MSSFTRNIQRAASRRKHYLSRGLRLGMSSPHDAARVARLARETRRAK